MQRVAVLATEDEALLGVVGVAAGLDLSRLALRVGTMLEPRPRARGASEEGWEKRWSALRPHVEGHLVAGGSSLPALLRSLDAGSDSRLAERLSRLGG